MEQQIQPAQSHQEPVKPEAKKKSLGFLIKKYFWYIVVFFIIAITSGVVMADHEAKSTANWQEFMSKEAGVSFKYPNFAKVIEDKGWRITIYMSEQDPENNIKILYSHKNPSEQGSAEEQFLANCQATKVSEINANNTRIKVYEDSTCGGQVVTNSVIVYSENGMNYDIGLFGTVGRAKLYQILSTMKFEPTTTTIMSTPAPTSSQSLIVVPNEPSPTSSSASPSIKPLNPSNIPDAMTVCTMDAMICPDGSTVGRFGPKCEFVCPQ